MYFVSPAYLERGNFNIIVVDWGPLVQLPCYPTAVLNTWQAGKCTAQLLANLAGLRMRGYDVSRIHAIGFSLGAHVAAYASNELRQRLGKQFGRITGDDDCENSGMISAMTSTINVFQVWIQLFHFLHL